MQPASLFYYSHSTTTRLTYLHAKMRPCLIDGDTPPHASHAPPARKCYNTAICKRFPGSTVFVGMYHMAICTRFPGPGPRVAATLVSESGNSSGSTAI